MRAIGILIALLLSSGVARAAPPDGAAASCSGSTLAMSECLKRQAAHWDERLNAAYKKALAAAELAQRAQLRTAQRLWIAYRDANCLYYGLGAGSIARLDAALCMRDMTERRAKELDRSRREDPAVVQAPSLSAPALSRFPSLAGSWGGIVRAGPGQAYAPVASLREGERVVLLNRSDGLTNDYPWFRIRFQHSREGFMWGGILCSLDQPTPDLFKICP